MSYRFCFPVVLIACYSLSGEQRRNFPLIHNSASFNMINAFKQRDRWLKIRIIRKLLSHCVLYRWSHYDHESDTVSGGLLISLILWGTFYTESVVHDSTLADPRNFTQTTVTHQPDSRFPERKWWLLLYTSKTFFFYWLNHHHNLLLLFHPFRAFYASFTIQ